MERYVSKVYNAPNRNIIFKDLLYVIHDQNIQRNLSMRNKESENLGLLFIGDGATISRTSLLNISVSAQNIPVKVF